MVPSQLRQQRKQLGISQFRLARLASVSRFKLALYELGDGRLTDQEQERLEHALKAQAAAKLQELASLGNPGGQRQ